MHNSDISLADMPSNTLARSGALPSVEVPWPMFGRDASHSSLGDSTGLGISNPKIEFDSERSASSTGTTIGNFSLNVELPGMHSYNRTGMGAAQSVGVAVNITEISSWKTMWHCNLTAMVRATPSIADLNEDGKLELVVACVNGSVYAFSPRIFFDGGNYTWNATNNQTEYIWHAQIDAPVTYSSPVFYDVNGDGRLDVVIGGGSRVYALEGRTGVEIWKCMLNGDVRSTPAPFKYNATSNWTIATSFNATTTSSGTYYAYWINAQGMIAQQKSYSVSGATFFPVNLASTPFPSPALVNLINDTGEQVPEVVIAVPYESGIAHVHVYYAKNYTLAWEYETFIYEQFYSTPASCDLDGDGAVELVMITSYFPLISTTQNFNIYALRGNGTLYWSYVSAFASGQYVEATPALVDIDEDSKPDIVVATLNGRVFAIDGDTGEDLWAIDLGGMRTLVFSSPAAGDFTSDGFVDIVVDCALVTHQVTDLAAGPIDMTPSPANEFDLVTINAIVLNLGDVYAVNVNVSFYVDDELIGNYTIPSISPGSSTSAQCEWLALGGGTHNVTVCIDPDDNITEFSEDNNNATAQLVVYSHYGVSLTATTTTYTVNPGVVVQSPITLTNMGDVNDTYNLTMSALPAEWTGGLSVQTATVAYSQSASIVLSVAVPSDAFATTQSINISARSQNNTYCFANLTITIIVRDQYGIELAPMLSTRAAFSAQASTQSFNFTVKNAGNAQDEINISAMPVHTPTSGWSASLSASALILVAGGSANVTMQVNCPSNTNDGDYAEFALFAVSTSDPTKNATAIARVETMLPDIALRNLTFYRADGTQVGGSKHLVAGEQSTIFVEVGNCRNALALPDVTVRFSVDGTTLSTIAVGELSGGAYKPASVSWNASEGDFIVEAYADPLNAIPEYNESNNILQSSQHIKSASAGGMPFFVFGTVRMPDGIEAASDCLVNATDLRTGEEISTITDSNGDYSLNLSNFASSYQDGDTVRIFALKGKMYANRTTVVYSEDVQTRIDLLLVPIDGYSFHFSGNTTYSTESAPVIAEIFVTNNCTRTNVINVAATGVPSGWSAQLSESAAFSNLSALSIIVDGKSTKRFYMRIVVPSHALGGTYAMASIFGVSQNDTLETNSFSVEVMISQSRTVRSTFEGIPARSFFLPGETFSCSVNISNTGNVQDSYTLSLAYPAGWAVEIEPPQSSLEIPAFSYEVVPVTVTISPTTQTPSMNVITLTATSETNSSVASTGTLSVRVDAKSFGVNLVLKSGEQSSKTALPGEKLTFNVVVENTGNWADIYSIAVSGASAWTKEFTIDGKAVDASRLNVSAGSALTVQFSLTPPITVDNEKSASNVILTAVSSSDATKTCTLQVTASVKANMDLAIVNMNTGNSLLQENKTIGIFAQIFTGEFRVLGAKVQFFVDGIFVSERSFDIPASSVASSMNISVDWLAEKGTHKLKLHLVLGEKVDDPSSVNNDVEITVIIKGKTVPPPPKTDYSILFYAIIAITIMGIAAYALTRPKPKPRKKVVSKKKEYDEEPNKERKTKPRDPDGLSGLGKI